MIFKKYQIDINKLEWDKVVHAVPEAAADMIKKLYIGLTGKKLHDPIPKKLEKVPYYARPTACLLLKDGELQRIADVKTQNTKAHEILLKHN